MKNNTVIIILTILFVVVCICLAALFILKGDIISRLNPPTPINTSLPVQTIIALTANVASTQTAMAPSPTPFPSFTTVPPLEIVPTATLYVYLTETPFIFPTQPPPTLQPTLAPPVEVCSCSGDIFKCTDFSSHSSAQACYNYCASIGKGDIHKLDNDGDGLACESLP